MINATINGGARGADPPAGEVEGEGRIPNGAPGDLPLAVYADRQNHESD